ncbi:MAG: VWA domain-containing protein [Nitrospira sp.]|nr:VWA domain-containing protein [Nitrospira sp.]
MKFASPDSMHFIWGIAALLAFLFWARRKRAADLQRFAESSLLRHLIISLSERRQAIKISLTVCAIVIMIIALARPQWGFQWREVKRSGLDIIIAIDTSKSMLATDVKPSRMERSKLAVKDFIKRLRGDRIGLIAFAGSSFLQAPLTADYNGFMLSLDDLNIGTIPKGGTSITSAIETAMKSYEGGIKENKILIIITDGEDHGGKPIEMAEKAGADGLKIYTIGIGSADGELIPIINSQGQQTFLKDRSGNVVKTRLDEATLKSIALKTGGSYIRATSTEFGLELLYDEKLSKIEKRDIENKMAKQYEDRFQILLIFALILLCLELFISERGPADQQHRLNF